MTDRRNFLPICPSRRTFVTSAAAALAASAIPQAFASSSSVAGRVLLDENGSINRMHMRGLPGVLVSNGLDVVRTDADGNYRLSAQAGSQIFVIKPADYALPVDARTSLPAHHRNVGDTSCSVDFQLHPSNASRSFSAVLMADPQPENHRHLDFLRDGAVPMLAQANAAFALTLGDIVGDNLALLDRYTSIMGAAGLQLWYAGGNHDLDFSAADAPSARAPFRRAFGPETHAFEAGEALFIVLDNVEYIGPGAGYRGRIGARQLAFVRNLLAHTPHEKLVVLAMHIPLRTEWNPLSLRDNTIDSAALLRLLEGRRAVSFSGHMHAAEHVYLPLANGGEHHHQVLAALSGSWWSGPYDHRGRPLALGVDGCPPGFHMLQVDGTQYATTFVPMQRQETRMRSVLARCAPCSRTGAHVIDGQVAGADLPCELAVNVFDGGPNTKVRLRLPGGEWQHMQRTRRADPFTLDHFAQPSVVRHDWVKPEPCEHLWTAPLPALGAGLHRIEIEARDEYGREMRDLKAIELV